MPVMELDSPEVAADSYCLNLHARYAPTWGTWEVARELYANAKDASPERMSIRSPDANTLEIHTDTVPDLAQLFIIGCGSKAPGGESIGQFGEGLKLAALTTTRTPGGSLALRMDGKVIRFSIRKHLGQDVLFADTTPAGPFGGYLCTLKLEGAGLILNGRIIEGAKSHWIAKPHNAPVQIFCKGVWICALDEPHSLFSYNLNDITLNRDRSMADTYSVRHNIGSLLVNSMTEELADRLAKNSMSWESNKCLDCVTWSCPEDVKVMLAAALKREYGERVVIATDLKYAARAREHGYNPKTMGDGIKNLVSGLIPTDVSILPMDGELHAVEEWEPAWRDMIAELMRLAELLDTANVSVRIFEDEHGDLLGMAVRKARLVWLNRRLMHYDNRFERVRTFLHELGHLQGGGNDATESFEASLDLLGARLAIIALDHSSNGTL